MDKGTGGTISDATINNNDGTTYGAARVAGFPFPSEAPPEAVSQIVFTNPERTVLVNEASEVMTIQARDAENKGQTQRVEVFARLIQNMDQSLSEANDIPS